MNDRERKRHEVRGASPADAEQISRLFYETIHAINRHDYTPQQLEAWAPAVAPAADWAARQEIRRTFVAAIGSLVVGFGELEDSGHVDCFYVHKDHQGEGVGSALMARIQDEAARRGLKTLFSEVSITAKPFFERQGFETVREQQVEVRGVKLTNYVMERTA